MDNKFVLNAIYKNAIQYHNNLEGKNILFVFGSRENTNFIETSFLKKHFLHLTGVKLTNGMSATLFYKRCLSNQISPNDFQTDFKVKLKLDVLPQVMKIYKNAKMCGDFDGNRLKLHTDKIIGNVTASIGFVKDGDYYVPNTVLEEDIRKVTIHPQQRILAIFRKPVKQKTYTELCYLANNIPKEALILPNEVTVKLDVPDLGEATLYQEPESQKLSDMIDQAKKQAQQYNAEQEKGHTRNHSELER